MQVLDALNIINNAAPSGLALSWDNSGLLIGNTNNEISKILLTLDVTKNAVEKAIAEKANLIISHHPLIFKGLKKITNPLILKIIKNDISVICAHTNLDSVHQGVNTALANALSLTNLKFLSHETGSTWYKIAVQTPHEYTQKIANVACENGAGSINNYTSCYNYQNNTGHFIPNKNANPYTGKKNQSNVVNEQKLEFVVDSFNLNKTINAIIKNHPYESPVYYVTTLKNPNPSYGIGFFGEINFDFKLNEFAEFVKAKLDAPFVKLWSPKGNIPIKKVAVCGGSGSSFLNIAKAKADVFVSGDFTYHTILDSNFSIIDAGHFYTEFPVLNLLKQRLEKLNCPILILQKNMHEICNLSYI